MDLQINGKQSIVNRALDEFDTVEEGEDMVFVCGQVFQVNPVVVHSFKETFQVDLHPYLKISA
jgi:hypothetical protein